MILPPQKYQHLLAAILHPLSHYLKKQKEQPLSDAFTIPPDQYYNRNLKGWMVSLSMIMCHINRLPILLGVSMFAGSPIHEPIVWSIQPAEIV